MPIDKSLLEPVRPGFDPDLLEWARERSQRNAENDKRRRDAIRQEYAYGLVGPISSERRKNQSRVLNEVTDPIDRQNLAEDVAKIAVMQDWQDRQERSKQGYLGRFGGDLNKVLESFASAGGGQINALTDLADLAVGTTRSPEDVKFMRQLEGASAKKEQADQENGSYFFGPSLINNPGVAGGALRTIEAATTGIAGMAPDMAAGMAALAAGGPGASAAYWTARQAPESREDFIEMGASEGKATALGLGVAGLTGVLEQAIPDPTGLVKNKGLAGAVTRGLLKKGRGVAKAVLRKELQHPLIKQVAGQATGAIVRTLGETAEEGIQSAVDEAVKYIVAGNDEKIEDRDLKGIWDRSIEAMIEAGPGIAVLGGAGGAVQAQQQAKRFGLKAKGFKQSKMETEIMRFANSGKVPSRSQWKKWGVLDIDGHSQKTRASGVRAIAARLQQLARVKTVIEGHVPTEQQWKDWGFDPEKGQTAEDRRATLFSQFEEGHAAAVEEKRSRQRAEEELRRRDEGVRATVEQAKLDRPVQEGSQGAPGTPEALKGVLSQVEGIEAAQQPPGNTEGVQDALRFASGLEGAVQPTIVGGETATPSIDVVEDQVVQQEPATEPAGESSSEIAQIEADSPMVNIQDAVEKKNSDLGSFIQDTAGRIGIDIEKVERGLKKTKGIVQRLALSRGELTQPVFEAKIRKEGKVNKINTRIRFTVNKFRGLEKKVFGENGMTGKDMAIVGEALRGNSAAMHSLDPSIRPVVAEMRSQVDALSSALRASGAVAGDLAAIIKGNEGVYLTRTYKAFQGPSWSKDIPTDVKNEFADFVRKEFPEKTDEQINGMIGEILYDAEKSGSPMALMASSHLGKKDLSILTPRKDLPPALRALLGEEENPLMNYAMSVSKIGNLLATHEFQKEIKNADGGEYFSREPTTGTDRGDLIAKIELDHETFYTTPELKAALDRDGKRENMPGWLRQYMKANSAVKISKTVLSNQTQARNIEANLGFAVANGHWRLGMIRPAWKATWAGLTGKGEKVWQNLYESAVEHGVVGQDTTSGELNDLARDARESDDIESYAYSFEARRASRVKKALRFGLDTAKRVYQAGDDMWKLYAWMNERVRYKKAFPNATPAEIKRKAADVVRNTYPTYSLVPEGVKKIRQLPVIGAFVSFRSEVIRTSYKTALLIKDEIKNPATRKIGYERLAGAMTASVALPALATALRVMFGVTKEEEEDFRRVALPEYQKNNTLLHTTGNVDGEFDVVDLTYTDPHGVFRQVWNAVATGDSIEDKTLGALSELFEPFIGDEILFAKLIDVRRNQKENGGQIYNEEDRLDNIINDMTMHVWDALEPGSVTTGERFSKGLSGFVSERGHKFSAARELGAGVFGQRVSDRDVRSSIPYHVRDFKRRKSNANDILTSVIGRGGNVSREEIRDAYSRSESARKSVYDDFKKVADSSVRLLKSHDEVRSIFNGGNVTLEDRNAAFSGVYPRRKFSKAFQTRVRNANPEEFQIRMQALTEAIQEENQKRSLQEQ